MPETLTEPRDSTKANIAAATPEFEAQAAAEAAKAAADAAKAAIPVVPVVPEKYDLKVPDGSGLDAAFVERTGAIARDLGLDQKGAEKLLTQRAQEIQSIREGGPLWTARNTQWTAESLADKELGAGDQTTLEVAVEKAQQALAKFGDDGLRADLKEWGWGSKPSVLRFLARIGRAMGEGVQIAGHPASGAAKKTDEQRMYPAHFNDDGSPKA